MKKNAPRIVCPSGTNHQNYWDNSKNYCDKCPSSYTVKICPAIVSAILQRSSPNLAQTTRTSSLAVKIGNQFPVLCACAVKSHVKVW